MGIKTGIISCGDTEFGITPIIKMVIEILSGGVGILGVLGIIIVGIQYLTSRGEPDKMAKAKKRLLELIIGVCLFVGIGGITAFLLPTSGEYDEEGLNDMIAQIEEEKRKAAEEEERRKAAEEAEKNANGTGQNVSDRTRVSNMLVGMHAPANNELEYVNKAASHKLHAVECDIEQDERGLMCYHPGHKSSKNPTLAQYIQTAKAANMKVIIDRANPNRFDNFDDLLNL